MVLLEKIVVLLSGTQKMAICNQVATMIQEFQPRRTVISMHPLHTSKQRGCAWSAFHTSDNAVLVTCPLLVSGMHLHQVKELILMHPSPSKEVPRFLRSFSEARMHLFVSLGTVEEVLYGGQILSASS